MPAEAWGTHGTTGEGDQESGGTTWEGGPQRRKIQNLVGCRIVDQFTCMLSWLTAGVPGS